MDLEKTGAYIGRIAMPLPEEYLRMTADEQWRALYRAMAEYKRWPPNERNQKARLKLMEGDSVTVWQPYSEGRLRSGLAIPVNGSVSEGVPMTRERYTRALEDRLRRLINDDPENARFQLTASPEHNPNLYAVARGSTVKEWPIQIMMCDQMHTRLGLINWDMGEYVDLSPSELPGIEEFVEVI